MSRVASFSIRSVSMALDGALLAGVDSKIFSNCGANATPLFDCRNLIKSGSKMQNLYYY